ncbi:uncharacterized protein TRIADDRAFT_55773 [Trichoplax adhaerens]|uniref:Uncharacterized protein n=1 Tax=Trichoplax adhaerens TaxID=10228 RepID=B3RVU0_TRIAD|nr:predicted protein [Trichoplax adhaerens]EDV25558.1 predicted protein [Trichoplax adhaerens]|eukprot:XP_002111591.1 predicted protein [Trichoplax adhaerens]
MIGCEDEWQMVGSEIGHCCLVALPVGSSEMGHGYLPVWQRNGGEGTIQLGKAIGDEISLMKSKMDRDYYVKFAVFLLKIELREKGESTEILDFILKAEYIRFMY